ncbi:uncharacterized protein LOC128205908 [Mya arenaria]|uniref:uncharacterized protein LOC128205908 n=1 Tax=Mya arenaria TaxID=6604 RepID=UPI0022E43FED|nr:uncharacterized protein LOC128205908 [Mya arenaria]
MASGIENTDNKVAPTDLDSEFNDEIVTCSHCWREAKRSSGETSMSEALLQEGLENAKKICSCFETMIDKAHMRENPGRKDRQDSGIGSKTSLEIIHPTDDTAEFGSRLSASHVVATSMSRACITLDEKEEPTE